MTDKLIFIVLLLYSSMAYAGGNIHPIAISDIKTISNQEYHILFHLLPRDNKEYYQKNVPMYQCQNVVLKIQHQEWEIDDKITSFFADIPMLFSKYNGKNSTKQAIAKIKSKLENQQNTFMLSDAQAFQSHPDNDCVLYSKYLRMSGIFKGSFDGGQDRSISLLQPTRHHSNIDNKFKK